MDDFLPPDPSDEKALRKQVILETLDTHLCDPDLPKVKREYARLRALGHSDEEARELMAVVLAIFMWHVARNDGYGQAEYFADLAKLPAIDWVEEG